MNQTATALQATPLGEILIRRGQVRKYQLEFLLGLQDMMKKLMKPISIGELLIKHRAVSALALVEALAVQESMPTDSVTEIVRGLENEESQITKAL
jgi:hypothetical protein